MLQFKDLVCKPRGIIHIGAHIGEEKGDYKCPVIWIEGNPRIISKLKSNVGDDKVICSAISNTLSTTTFNITTDSESSSLKEFDTHVKHYPDIEIQHKIIVEAKPFSHIVTEYEIDMENYNCLVISTGGNELDVLKGMDKYIDMIDYVLTKVYMEDVYKGSKNVDAINHYLKIKGFKRKKLKIGDKGWGSAFYVK